MSGGTGRYTSRVDSGFLKSLEAQGIGSVSGDDIYCLNSSANNPRRRITAARLVELGEQLTARDLQVLQTLKDLRLATISQLQRIHFQNHASQATARRVARRVLARLQDLDAIDRLERRIGGARAGSAGHIYTLTSTGHRLCGDRTRKRSHEPKLHHVQHTLAISDLVAQLYQSAHADSFEIDELQTEPSCWRSAIDDNAKILKPDLYACLATSAIELSWFIEIDLGTESSTVLERKLRTYNDYWRAGREQRANGVFPKVAWIASTPRRADFIAEVIATTSDIEPRLFEVGTTNEAIELLSAFDNDENAP